MAECASLCVCHCPGPRAGCSSRSCSPPARPAQAEEPYDLVIRGGRVIDPQSGLDAVRNVGIRGGRIAAVTEAPLDGASVLDARGLVVAPGFIDLHNHAFAPHSQELRVQDGVTTALELEDGVPEPGQVARRAGRASRASTSAHRPGTTMRDASPSRRR